jgi:hypothetical protein
MTALAVLVVFTLIGVGVFYVFRVLMSLWLFVAIGMGLLTIIVLTIR